MAKQLRRGSQQVNGPRPCKDPALQATKHGGATEGSQTEEKPRLGQRGRDNELRGWSEDGTVEAEN